MNGRKLSVDFLLVFFLLLGLPLAVDAQTVFSDNFDSGASPSWGNQSGNWVASGGSYYAQNVYGGVYSGLPFVLTNFTVEVDVRGVADGGIWLRKSATNESGVLLVTGGDGWGPGSRTGNAGQVLYWHTVTNGSFSPYQGEVFGLFTPTVSDAHLRIVVSNNIYSAFLNGDATPITSITNSWFASGQVGLYSYSGQSFDNFSINLIQPLLDIHNGLFLSWPADFTGYVLEETTNLNSPDWVTAPYPVSTVNQVVLPSSEANKYFRLRKP